MYQYEIRKDLALSYQLSHAESYLKDNFYELFVWDTDGELFASLATTMINHISHTFVKLGLQS